MNRVIDVKPLDDHRIWLRFDDAAQGEVDLTDLAGRGVFATLADQSVSSAVRVDTSGGIEWPREIDMCPDALGLTGKTSRTEDSERQP